MTYDRTRKKFRDYWNNRSDLTNIKDDEFYAIESESVLVFNSSRLIVCKHYIYTFYTIEFPQDPELLNDTNTEFREYGYGGLKEVLEQTCAFGDGTYYDILKEAGFPLPPNNILPGTHDNWDEWL